MATAKSTIALPAPKNLTDASLVFGVCLFVMAIIVIFMVIRIPRLLALFGTSSDGVILRHVPAYPPPRVAQPKRHAPNRSPPAAKESNTFGSSMDDIISQRSYPSERSLLSKVRVRDARKRYPPHIPSLPKALRPLLKPFRTRISPGFSFGQLLVLAVYLAILLYATIHNSNIFLDQSRTGWIAVSQFPFVYAFAQKNNFIGTFLGFGYEKVELSQRC
jgi:ferric-chelate reductase